MIRSKNKGVILALTSLMLFFGLITNINAVENVEENIESDKLETRAVGDYYSWRAVGSSKVDEVTKGSWIHIYTGEPSSRSGERDSFSKFVEVKRELSGTINITYKQLEGILGYDVTHTDRWTVTKTSATLDKGEYIKAYYKKNYTKNKVTQRQYITTNGLTSPTDKYAYAYSLKPLMPKLKIEYYSKNNKLARSAGDTLYKTETYDSITGELEEIVYN